MNRWISLPKSKLLAFAAGALVLGAIQPTPAGTGREKAWDTYSVLAERNIFLRDRGRRRWTPTLSTRPVIRATYDSDSSVVLRGIALRGDEFVAFFEDNRTNETSRVHVGQAVGKGVVRSIALDGVEYERGGRLSSIDIGWSLTGSEAPMRVEPTVATAPAAPEGPADDAAEAATGPAEPATRPAAAGPSAPPGSPSQSDTLEQQMIRRRQQELRR